MMTYIIVVNDNGEMKTITEAEVDAYEKQFAGDRDGYPDTDSTISNILDKRSDDFAKLAVNGVDLWTRLSNVTGADRDVVKKVAYALSYTPEWKGELK